MKKICSVLFIAILCFSLTACGKSEAFIAAENVIKEIGTVTLESKSAIEAAEKSINDLPEEEKNKDKLLNKIESIKKEYTELEEGEKVKKTIELIDSIGEITLDSGEKIDEAISEYNKIDDSYKNKVTNKGKLDEAEKIIAELRATEKDRIISDKTPLFTTNYDKIEKITWYEHKSMPQYIDVRSYIIPYIGKRDSGDVWVCIRYNYTADSWIFWENMTIMVDGEKFFKYPSRNDLVRDNDTEVWEWYDEVLDINVGMNNEDLQMLKKIAESEETIIRFQGDEYNYDLTVSATDKKIISDVLALYQALIW